LTVLIHAESLTQILLLRREFIGTEMNILDKERKSTSRKKEKNSKITF
jgi:hypothetical protein